VVALGTEKVTEHSWLPLRLALPPDGGINSVRRDRRGKADEAGMLFNCFE
jgi:hypothetical protein